MNKTMLFGFESPIIFERVYDFKKTNNNFNFSWHQEDSNPEVIKSDNYKTKKTLVESLYATFYPMDYGYGISLFDNFGLKDSFFVPIEEFPNFLRKFNLL